MRLLDRLVGMASGRRRTAALPVAAAVRARFPIPVPLEQEIARINATMNQLPGGWCPADKQQVLAYLVLTGGVTRAVEIGVFQGGSLFPLAAAMRSTGGLVIGIDPYSSDAAEEHDNRERVVPLVGEDWHRRIDWNALHERVARELVLSGVSDHARLVREPSARAAPFIEPGLDLLHIDGNHDYDAVAADIAAYVPKVRSGGFIVVDDTAWDTIHPQYVELKRTRAVYYEALPPGKERPEWGVLVQP